MPRLLEEKAVEGEEKRNDFRVFCYFERAGIYRGKVAAVKKKKIC